MQQRYEVRLADFRHVVLFVVVVVGKSVRKVLFGLLLAVSRAHPPLYVHIFLHRGFFSQIPVSEESVVFGRIKGSRRLYKGHSRDL